MNSKKVNERKHHILVDTQSDDLTRSSRSKWNNDYFLGKEKNSRLWRIKKHYFTDKATLN